MERELYLGQQRTLFDREATVVLYRDTFTVADGDWCGWLLARTSRPSPARYLLRSNIVSRIRAKTG